MAVSSPERTRQLGSELLRFLCVGGTAFIVELVTFNLLRYGGAPSSTQEGPLHDKILTAKVVAVIVATVVAYTGNRLWTYRESPGRTPLRGYLLFFLLNAIGLVIGLVVLGVSHYLLGLTTPLEDNLANILGIAAGTAFRFWSYRTYVFTTDDEPLAETLRDPV